MSTITDIKIKRSTKQLSDATFQTEQLDFGEPFVTDSTDGTFFSVGNQGTSGHIIDEKFVKLVAKTGANVPNNPVFHNGTIAVKEDGSTAVKAACPNAITFNNGGSGVSSGTTYDGSTARTVSYNTIGAAAAASPTITGTATIANITSSGNVALTGNATATTRAAGTNNTQLATTAFVTTAVANKSIVEPKTADTTTTNLYVTGTASANGALKYNTNVKINCATGVLYGAAWNDIAEFRVGTYNVPGACVVDTANGLRCSTGRMQKNPYIVSDTYGFAIGETEEAKVPVAIAGRALATVDPIDLRTLKIGDAVCSGLNGMVSKMNRFEMIFQPECILGYVSEFPVGDYNGIDTTGRVWIKIK